MIGGTSTGEGINCTTASSSACTPLFLNAVPQRQGTMSLFSVPMRKAVDDLLFAQLTGFKVGFHQFLGCLGGHFHHVFTRLGGGILQVGGNLTGLVGDTHVLLLPVDSAHLHQVDDAGEVFFSADRQLNGHGARAQAILDLTHNPLEVGAGAVHLVDEGNARYVVAGGLAPYRFGLGLYATDCTENGNGTIKHAQRALHFDGEVNVSRGIDDIDPVLRELLVHAGPEAGSGSRGNGDTALLLLLHPVHGGGAFMHFTDFVRDTRVEQDALGRRRLAGINVRHDADVAITINGVVLATFLSSEYSVLSPAHRNFYQR